MFSVPSAARRSPSRARPTAAPSRSARHASTSARSSDSTAGSTRRMEPRRAPPPASGESGDSAVSVKQLTPTTWSSPVSMRRTRSAWLPTRRDLSSSMASNAPPRASTSSSSAHDGLGHLGRLLLDDHRAVEDVAVLQQVGLEGQDLLDAEGPLLVPGPGKAEGLVPRRQLQGPGPGPLGQGDPERLQHDAGDVVLRLGLGQAQGVDLDAVAHAAEPGVGDAVALGADPVPQGGEGPHLAGLLHEANSGVHEERDAAHHRRGTRRPGSGPTPARRRGRRWRWPGRRPPPGGEWPRPPGGGSCRR